MPAIAESRGSTKEERGNRVDDVKPYSGRRQQHLPRRPAEARPPRPAGSNSQNLAICRPVAGLLIEHGVLPLPGATNTSDTDRAAMVAAVDMSPASPLYGVTIVACSYRVPGETITRLAALLGLVSAEIAKARLGRLLGHEITEVAILGDHRAADRSRRAAGHRGLGPAAQRTRRAHSCCRPSPTLRRHDDARPQLQTLHDL